MAKEILSKECLDKLAVLLRRASNNQEQKSRLLESTGDLEESKRGVEKDSETIFDELLELVVEYGFQQELVDNFGQWLIYKRDEDRVYFTKEILEHFHAPDESLTLDTVNHLIATQFYSYAGDEKFKSHVLAATKFSNHPYKDKIWEFAVKYSGKIADLEYRSEQYYLIDFLVEMRTLHF